MKIVITGGGSGGHFYPLISVAEKIREQGEDLKILPPKMYYLAEHPYDKKLLTRYDIEFIKISTGKLRTYFSIKNFFDMFKTFFAVLDSLFLMFRIYPDIVFTNGGYVAFPVLVAAKLLRIPVIIHISDTVPSRVCLFASKFAKKISIAFPEATEYLGKIPKGKIALLGNPVREQLTTPLYQGAQEFLGLDPTVPTLFILGGSQGSQAVNSVVIDALPTLLEKYNIIHQTGKKNLKEVNGRVSVVLSNHAQKDRYRPFAYLDLLAMRMAAGIAALIISRAGAGSISEISNWGKASILVPIPKKISRDQEKNAFSYARAGGCVVIKQPNLAANVLSLEIKRILEEKEVRRALEKSAKNFAKPDAAEKIAAAILKIVISHEE